MYHQKFITNKINEIFATIFDCHMENDFVWRLLNINIASV